MSDVGYVTLEAADAYIEEHYISEDPLRECWEDLDDADREALLLTSFEAIELLTLSGRRTSPHQVTAFPRFPDTEVPSAVRAAQIENALALSDLSYASDVSEYRRLRLMGVTSYKIGHLSETLGGTASNVETGIVSDKALKLLQRYMSGSFSIVGRCRK